MHRHKSDLQYAHPRISRVEFGIAQGLIVIIHLLILVNPIFGSFDTTNLAIVFSILGMLVIAMLGMQRWVLLKFQPAIFFILIVGSFMLVDFIRLDGVFDGFFYAPLIFLWPALWICLFARYGRAILQKCMGVFFATHFVIAAIAYIQYFSSPTLWGFLDIESNALMWASEQEFENYSTFFRATSLVGSPQVLAVLMPIFGALCLLSTNKNRLLKICYTTFLFGAGLLSGGKAAGILVGTALIVWAFLIVRNWRARQVAVVLGVLAVGAGVLFFVDLDSFEGRAPILERVFDFDAAIEQEMFDSRIDRYVEILKSTNPLIGNGYSSHLFSDITGFRAAESYIGKLYFHYGVLPIALLLFLLYRSFYGAHREECRLTRIAAGLVFVSLWVSAAFESTSFFPVWGIILASLLPRNEAHPMRQAKELLGPKSSTYSDRRLGGDGTTWPNSLPITPY
jgi:hypothetical protein